MYNPIKMYLYYVVLFVLIFPSLRNCAILPSSVLTENILFDGIPSTQQVITFTCSESNPQGQLQVGDYNVNIQCQAPVTEYILTEIARVPQAIFQHVDGSCSVSNPDAFTQLLNSLQNNLLPGTQRRLLESVEGGEELEITHRYYPAARELKQFDPVSFSIAVAALIKVTALEKQHNALSDKVDQYGVELKTVGDQLNELSYNVRQIYQIENSTQKEITILNQNMVIQNEAMANITNAQNSSISALQTLTQGTQNSLNKLQADLRYTQQQTAAFVNAQNNATDLKLIALADAMQQVTSILNTQITKLNLKLEQLKQNLNSRDSSIEDIYSNRVLLTATIASIHESISKVQQELFPLFTTPGVHPTSLSGVDLINLQEYVNVNFVTPSVGSVYEIHNVKMYFYLDTDLGLKQQVQLGVQVLPLESMITYFSSPGCQRAFVVNNASPDPISDIPCGLWVETEDIWCSTTLSPAFDWGNRTQQVVQLDASFCTSGNGGIQPSTKKVLKSFDQFMSFVATDLCPKRRPGTKFQLQFTRGQAIGYFDPLLDCSIAWDDAFESAIQNGTSLTLAQILLSGVNTVWPLANVDLNKRKLKKYGAFPGGVSIKDDPYYYVPPQYNSTSGEYNYDGSAQPDRCTFAYWNTVHRNTVPIYSIIPANNPAVIKDILVDVEGRDGFVCQDPTLCYPLGVQHITHDIILQTDRPPKQQQTVFAGSLLPSIVASNGIYDVPEPQLQCTPNPRSNENSACYYRMKPGTTTTISLNQWIEENGNVYDPLKASVSMDDFRFPAVFDRDGFPLCSIPGAILPGTLSNITVDPHNCNNPYIWANGTLPTVFDTIPTNNMPSECLQPSTTILFKELNDHAQQLTYGLDAGSLVAQPHGVFTFWFQSYFPVDTGTETNIVVVRGISAASGTKFLKFIVDSNGIPAVVVSNSISSTGSLAFDTRTIGTTGSRILTANLRDSVLHYLVFKYTIDQYNTANGNALYELWIDDIYQGQYKTSNGAYLRSDAAPVFLNPGYTGTDDIPNQDSIQLGLLNSLITNINLNNSYSCQQSWMNKRCSQPTLSNERLIIARQNVTDGNGVFCISSAQLVVSTSAFDAAYPLGLISANRLFITNSSWSIGFWIKLPAFPVAQQYVSLRNNLNSVRIALNSVSQLLDLYVNNVVVASLNIEDRGSHIIHIVYNGVYVLVYLDAKLAVASVNVSPNTAGSGTVKDIATGLNYVSMLKYYPGLALTPDQVTNEMRCQIDASLATSSFVPPIGFCEQSLTDSYHGYCRSPLLCAGHCSAYATIDNVTHTFVVGSVNCDDGFQTPDCVKRCERIDETTGRCIDLSSTYAPGATPLGYICELAKTAKLEMNLPANRLYATDRQFLYLVTVQVPTGTVTSILGNAVCPKLELVDLKTGELLALFENSGDVESNIAVQWAPEAYVADPNNVECTASCCNYNTQGHLMSIPAHLTLSIPIPTCGNMTIKYSRLGSSTVTNQYFLCSSLSAESISAAVATSASTTTATTISTITTIVDNSAEQLYSIQQKIAEAAFDAIIFQASLMNVTNSAFGVFYQLKNQIVQSSLLTFNTTFDPFNLTGLVEADLRKARDSLNSALVNVQQSNELLQQIPVIQAMVAAILANGSDALTDLQKRILGNIVAITLTNAIDTHVNADDPFSEIGNGIRTALNGVINGATDVALTAAHAGESLIDTGLNLVGLGGGGILGGIGGMFKTLIQILPFIAIAAVLYFAYSKGWFNKCCKKKQQPQEHSSNADVHNTTPADPETAHLVPKNQQQSTAARRKIYRIAD
jgi:hypothetical protein